MIKYYDWEVMYDQERQLFYAEIFDEDSKVTVHTTKKYAYDHTAHSVAQQWIATATKDEE